MNKKNNIALTIFNADIVQVKSALQRIPIFNQYQISSFYLNNNESVLNYLIPEYVPIKIQMLLFNPQFADNITICYTNLVNGWPEIFEGYSETINIEMYDCLINEEKYEAYHFYFFYKTIKRHILCYQDPRWVFYEDGEPLLFEKNELYKSKIKKQRLNKDIILHYLDCIGCNIEKKGFWQPSSEVLLFEQKNESLAYH